MMTILRRLFGVAVVAFLAGLVGVGVGLLVAPAAGSDTRAWLAGKVQEHLTPIYEKRKQLLENPKELDEIIHTGTKKARIVARETMEEVREAVFNSR